MKIVPQRTMLSGNVNTSGRNVWAVLLPSDPVPLLDTELVQVKVLASTTVRFVYHALAMLLPVLSVPWVR